MLDWIAIVGGTFVTLLPITNPFSTAPVFASMTSRFSKATRNRQARLAAFYMTVVLLVTLFIGALVMTFFGIGMPALRIAGGLLIARVGFSMVNPESPALVSDEGKNEALHMADIAFTPIAMPLLSGPGSMAATLTMASVAEVPLDYVGVAIGIGIVAFVTWLVLRSSTKVAAYLGITGMNALTRIMGFLLICISVEFIATGFYEGLTDPAIMGAIVDAVRQASGQ